MRKIPFLLIAFFAFIGFSCNDFESMQEKLRKEKKAIEAFIKRNDINVLNEYPKDGVFGENDYFRTAEGLYIQVVDSGNGTRVVPYIDEVQVRFDYLLDIKEHMSDETTGKYLGETLGLPKEFIYGNSASYAKDINHNLPCDGWALPLAYVGERAIVNLIVPSSLAGSSYSNNFTPLYFKNLRYTAFY